MTAVQYAGHEVMTYPGFLDTATGRTLTCVPGETYDVIPASGTSGDVPGDGRFQLVKTKSKPAKTESSTLPETDVPDPA